MLPMTTDNISAPELKNGQTPDYSESLKRLLEVREQGLSLYKGTLYTLVKIGMNFAGDRLPGAYRDEVTGAIGRAGVGYLETDEPEYFRSLQSAENKGSDPGYFYLYVRSADMETLKNYTMRQGIINSGHNPDLPAPDLSRMN